MKVYNLDGKVMPTLSNLVSGKSAPARVIELKPGAHVLITRGVGVPGSGFPKRCLRCRRLIRRGESWQVQSNGEYSTVRHSPACKIKTSVL